ncbi:hypothetical protein LZ24_00998 [Desulfobotulus alkaliphilus]|uniref:Uncharacterized protein n=1 Tax=Desulfobotulus alkaliphilus TaxID=622671 RepID=A0A562RZM6_9BACT|nr:hypothetical protein [Desulfobotulus alkaliphilus]TWI74393.1 hypothetical protein LZ24_00998 [Desulfobotulus alkaliphilus]
MEWIVLFVLFFLVFFGVRRLADRKKKGAAHFICTQCGENDCICHEENRDQENPDREDA